MYSVLQVFIMQIQVFIHNYVCEMQNKTGYTLQARISDTISRSTSLSQVC